MGGIGKKANSGVLGAATRGDPDLTAIVTAGDEKAYYSRFAEFGTVKTQAQPFFYPAWRASRKKIRSNISRASNSAAKKVAGG